MRLYALSLLAALIASLTTLAVLPTGPAWATDTTDAVPALVPYRGTLERNGEPVTDTVSLTFDLSSLEPSGSTKSAWSETQTVDVTRGRFSVLLGSTSSASGSSLAAAMTAADDLYLTITLTTTAGSVKLGKTQRFLPARAALWATAATSLTIAGDLEADTVSVTGDVTVSGAATLGDVVSGEGYDLGLQSVTCQQVSSCACPTGYRLIGGGAQCVSSAVPDMNQDYPTSDTAWHAQCNGSNTSKTYYTIRCIRD